MTTQEKIDLLLEAREECINLGAGMSVLMINEQLAELGYTSGKEQV